MLIANIKFLDVIDDEIHFTSVKSDYIDKEIFNDAMKDAEKLRQNIKERNEETPFFEKLSEDLFNALYKVAPKVYNKANVAVSLKMENELLNILINNANFNKIRRNTAFDLFNSTYALSMFLDKAYKIIEDWTKQSEEHKFIMDNINTAIKYQEQLRYINQQMMYDPEDNLLIQQVSDLKKLINQANNNIINAEKKPVDGSNTLNVQKIVGHDNNTLDINSLGCSLVEILVVIQKKLCDDCTLFKLFFNLPKYPGNEAGEFQKVSYEEKIEFGKLLAKSSAMKHISKKLGKMRSLIYDNNKKISKYGYAITDVGIGNNINRILSSEKMLLCDKHLENQFFKKYLNKTFLQYETQGENEIKGPIIVCVDNSESMKGDKDYFAKATAIAMLQLAVLEKRPYRCMLFDSSVVYVADFQKNEYDLKKIIELAETFHGGGTEFEPPLKKAVETIEEYKYKKADILFITDGEPVKFLPKDFKSKLDELKKKRKFIIQGIKIGTSNNSYMKEFCDHVIRFEDLINEEELINIFNNIKY